VKVEYRGSGEESSSHSDSSHRESQDGEEALVKTCWAGNNDSVAELGSEPNEQVSQSSFHTLVPNAVFLALRNVCKEFVRIGRVESGRSRESIIKRLQALSNKPDLFRSSSLGAEEQAGGRILWISRSSLSRADKVVGRNQKPPL
jgi:hypothetical protein